MADKIYGVIEKGPTSQIHVKSGEYNNKTSLHIREHYLTDDGKWLPTKKGFTLSEDVQIEELITALEKAKEDF